jgi:hypothetical protein
VWGHFFCSVGVQCQHARGGRRTASPDLSEGGSDRAWDCGQVTSDGGALLPKQLDEALGLSERVAARFSTGASRG